MARAMLMAAVGFASLVAVSAAQAATVSYTEFEFDFGKDKPLPNSTTWQATKGPKVLTLGIVTNGGELTQTMDKDTPEMNQGGLGIKSSSDVDTGKPDSPTTLLNPGEMLMFSFDPAVAIHSIQLTVANNGDTGEIGSGFYFVGVNSAGVQHEFEVTQTDPGTFNVLADLNCFSLFHLKAKDGDGFRLKDIKANVCATAVPLPAAVWGGMALMGMLGANRARKRLHLA